MTAAPLTRDSELWVQKLLARRDWVLAEALAWVVCRDAAEVGDILSFGKSSLYTEEPSVIVATCQLIAQEGEETEPWAALELALIKGDVRAFADYSDKSNGLRPVLLDAADWEYFEFVDSWRGASAVADQRRWRGGHDRTGLMINTRFDRASVLASFPPAREPAPGLRLVPPAPPKVEPEAVASTGPNVTMGQLSLRKWLLDEKADGAPAVARRRLAANGVDEISEDQLRAELHVMLLEQKKSYVRQSIDAIRRGGGFKVRID